MRLRMCMALVLVLAGCSEPEDGGFAGLATQSGDGEAAAFLQPGPGDTLTFPDDLGPHPRHRIEWWYLTANLVTADGEPLGLQWTQFRQALVPRAAGEEPQAAASWPLHAAWMAHGAVSYGGQHWFAEKLARGDVGHAGSTAQPFRVWLDDWQLASASEADRWRLRVNADDWSYDLHLQSRGAPIPHGDRGFSAKSASGEGSMYFSLVDLSIAGTVTLAGTTHQVSGQGWFDREWSSQFLKASQQGWDWFALHLDSGDKLMAFRLREEGGDFLSGTWVTSEREVVALGPADLAIDPQARQATSRGEVPTRWRIAIPGQQAELVVEAAAGEYWNQGLFTYWESPVTVSGSHTGVGYMELTGYTD